MPGSTVSLVPRPGNSAGLGRVIVLVYPSLKTPGGARGGAVGSGIDVIELVARSIQVFSLGVGIWHRLFLILDVGAVGLSDSGLVVRFSEVPAH